MNDWSDWNRWLIDRAGDVARGDVKSALDGMRAGPFGPGHDDGHHERSEHRGSGPWPGTDEQRDLLRQAVEVWFSMAEALVGGAWGMARQAGQTATAPGDDERRDPLTIRVRAGQRASGALWLKNHSSDVIERLDFRCTTPESPTGERLDPATLSCEPSSVERVLPGASSRVDVAADIPASAEPGVYYALMLVEQIPATCRSIRIDVEAD
jgi:hypothetical protein